MIMTKQDIVDKVEWEGGLDGAISYGLFSGSDGKKVLAVLPDVLAGALRKHIPQREHVNELWAQFESDVYEEEANVEDGT